MAPKLTWAIVAFLLVAPATAPAQQQQGEARAVDYLTRAQALVSKKRFKAAIAAFDSVLRVDPTNRDAVLGRAQVLAWTGQLSESVRAYEAWAHEHPLDAEASELLARTMSWAGRLGDAESRYRVLAAAGSREAERALARLTAWRGDLVGSERQWRAILDRRPTDSQAWVGLAYVLRWTNRPREARGALIRAVEADRTNSDAAEQLKWVDAALAPHVDPTIASLDDTDGNRVLTVGATAALAAPWDGELSVRGQRRAATAGALRASSLSAAVSASRATGRFAFRGTLGAARLDDESAVPGTAAHEMLTATAMASTAFGSRGNIGVGIGREPFDETAAIIRRGIVATTFGAGGTMDLARRVTVSAKVEHARLTGATPNSRTGGSGWIRWRAPHVLALVTNVQAFGYASDPGEGYFAPRHYVLAEAGAQLAVGRELGWAATFDGGVGAQTLNLRNSGSETQPAARGALGIVYRPTPRLEWGVTGQLTNAASPATSSFTSYRTTAVSFRARVSF